jgi:pyruvate,water dikinase
VQARDDVFFLDRKELETLLAGPAKFDMAEIIAARKAEYALNQSLTPPPVIVGRFDPEKLIPVPVYGEIKALKGLAVSTGVATGRARVILRADTEERVQPGEILVAPLTDPGWTPYFIPAAAIVMELGGQLTHGSIVAREYGIPAVANVGSATKIIKTGQMIRVDGTHGIVTILSEERERGDLKPSHSAPCQVIGQPTEWTPPPTT